MNKNNHTCPNVSEELCKQLLDGQDYPPQSIRYDMWKNILIYVNTDVLHSVLSACLPDKFVIVQRVTQHSPKYISYNFSVIVYIEGSIEHNCIFINIIKNPTSSLPSLKAEHIDAMKQELLLQIGDNLKWMQLAYDKMSDNTP